MRILERENESLLTVIHVQLFISVGLPRHRRENAQEIPVLVQNISECVCVAQASVVKVGGAEIVAIILAQK
jgi:hypothetical protein